MQIPSTEGGSFQLPPIFNDLSPKAKISLFKSLVSDPLDDKSYPSYDYINSKNGEYYYHSKDNLYSYKVYQDNEDNTIVERYNAGSTFLDKKNWSFGVKPSLGKASYDMPYSNADESKWSSKGPSVSLDGSGSVWKTDYKETYISNADGSGHSMYAEIDLSKLKLGVNADIKTIIKEMSWKKISGAGGVDLVKGKVGINYIESPRISVDNTDINNPSVTQYEVGLSFEAGVGVHFDIKSWSDIKELYKVTKLKPITLGVGPEFESHNGPLKEIPLTEKDFLALQNEGIKKILQENEVAELKNDLIITDFDNLGKPAINYTPTLSDDQKKILDQQLHENGQRINEISQKELQDKTDSKNNNNSFERSYEHNQKMDTGKTLSQGSNYQQSHNSLDLQPILRSIEQGIQQLQNNLSKG